MVMVEFCPYPRAPALLPQALVSTRHQFLKALNLERGDDAVS